ncbi:MAG: hypothetical protein JWO88_3885 [Frankiales bacterium]|nr:hypothetical protein [Frankiales bacterium]
MQAAPTELRLAPEGGGDPDGVKVWDLDARELAQPLTPDLVQAMRRARRTFVKVDSLMRGRWADLVTSCIKGSELPAVMCTALPRLGRGMRAGLVELAHLHTGPVECGKVSAFDALAGKGLKLAHLRVASGEVGAQSLSRSLRESNLTIVDASSHEELLALAAALESLSFPYMAIGSAGLAAALARTLGIPLRREVPPVLPTGRAVLVGSRTSRAREQLDRLADACGQRVRCWDPATGFAGAEAGADAFGVRIYATTRARVEGTSGRGLADAFVRASLAELCSVKCFVATGGETARALCEALGATGLQVLGQMEDGISLARLQGPPSDVFLILKSGSFGDPGALLRMACFGRDAIQQRNV